MIVERPRFADIQVLRAIACLMVLLQHISLTPALFSLLPGAPAMPFYLGVELFFVISGYVVTRSLFGRGSSATAFIVRRFFRLTPAIVAFLLFSAIVLALISVQPNQDSPKMLGMVGADRFVRQAVAIMTGTLINLADPPLYYFGAMWSLSVEYQFYFAYALLTGILAVCGVGIEKVKAFVLAICVIALSAILMARMNVVVLPASCELGICDVLRYCLNWRFDFLIFGVLLALVTDRTGRVRLPGRASTLLICGMVLAVTLGVGMWAEPPLDAIKPRHDHVLMPLSAVTFTVLVALAAGVPSQNMGAGVVLRTFVWLGDRSYSMYLFHFPVMALVWVVIANYAPGLFYKGPFVYGVAQSLPTFAITILLADLTFRHVERPWNTIGEHLSSRFGQRS